MSSQTNKINKIELSDEQLETVTGGITINALDLSIFNSFTDVRLVETSANSKGAFTKSETFRNRITSLALSELFIKS